MNLVSVELSIFGKEITLSKSIWVLKRESNFVMFENQHGYCLPVWSTRKRLIAFLEQRRNLSDEPLEIPINLFFTVWWHEVQTLAREIGINWHGRDNPECTADPDGFETFVNPGTP